MSGAATSTERVIVRLALRVLAGHDRDVLEAAQRAERHLAESLLDPCVEVDRPS